MKTDMDISQERLFFFSEAVSAAGLSAGRQRVSCGSERPKNIQIKGCSHESRPGVEPKTL